jgi:diguanylate cyclase (GGDEF)-like protein
MLTLLSFITLRTYIDQNLNLIARSIAYSAEAAAVFGDTAAAQDVLVQISSREELGSARILDAEGQVLAHYEARADGAVEPARLHDLHVRWAPRAEALIVADGKPFGRVVVQGNGKVYLFFLLKVLGAIGVCLAAIAWMVSGLSRRIERDLVQPLNRLASLTHKARTDRNPGLRAPAAEVREIHELGEDFNALLAEIESREASLVARHDTLKTVNESLSYLAFHDQLTGLPNRASFLKRASETIEARIPQEGNVAVLFLDCDDFKHINDSLGHAAGDEVLMATAQRVRAVLRDGDVVARLGGDEFAVLLSPIRGIDDAERLADKIAQAIREPLHTTAFGALLTSASVGVALCPDHGEDVDAVLEAADAAMYRAKARGNGNVCVFDTVLDGMAKPIVA